MYAFVCVCMSVNSAGGGGDGGVCGREEVSNRTQRFYRKDR